MNFDFFAVDFKSLIEFIICSACASCEHVSYKSIVSVVFVLKYFDFIDFSINEEVSVKDFLVYFFWQVANPQLSDSNVTSWLLGACLLHDNWDVIVLCSFLLLSILHPKLFIV